MKLVEKVSLFEKMATEALRAKSAKVATVNKAGIFEKSAQAYQATTELAGMIPHLWTQFTNSMRTPELWSQIPLANRNVLNDVWATTLKNVDAMSAAKLLTELREFFKSVPEDVRNVAYRSKGNELLSALDQFAKATASVQSSIPAEAPMAPTAPVAVNAPVANKAPHAPHKGPAQFLTDYMKQQEDSEAVDGVKKNYQDMGYIPQQ